MSLRHEEPTPEELAEFHAWMARSDAAKGARECLADGICPYCEERTLTVTATDTAILLSCPCLSR